MTNYDNDFNFDDGSHEDGDMDMPEGGVFIPAVFDENDPMAGLFIPYLGGAYRPDLHSVVLPDVLTGIIRQVNFPSKKYECPACLNKQDNLESKEVMPEEVQDEIQDEIQDDNLELFFKTITQVANTLKYKWGVDTIQLINPNVFRTNRYMLVTSVKTKELNILLNKNNLENVFTSELSLLIGETCFNFGWTIMVQGYYTEEET